MVAVAGWGAPSASLVCVSTAGEAVPDRNMPQPPGSINPDQVCALQSNKGKGCEQGVTT